MITDVNVEKLALIISERDTLLARVKELEVENKSLRSQLSSSGDDHSRDAILICDLRLALAQRDTALKEMSDENSKLKEEIKQLKSK